MVARSRSFPSIAALLSMKFEDRQLSFNGYLTEHTVFLALSISRFFVVQRGFDFS